MKLRHRDAVRQALMNRLGLREVEADFMIRIAEREYGFAEPPEGEAPEVTLRLLATMEYVKGDAGGARRRGRHAARGRGIMTRRARADGKPSHPIGAGKPGLRPLERCH
jgi:hypothetical protein